MKRHLAATAVLVLAAPAAAAAHPGVYTVTQLTRPAGQTCTIDTQPDPAVCLTETTQYAVANDGWARAFTETNGLPSGAHRGVLNYKALPGGTDGWRGGPENRAKWLAYAPAQTDLQAHAVCVGVPALENGANILSWQNDPFYNYIPWQATSAGLGDEPAAWIGVVKALTGVDLAALSGDLFAAECERIGGTYYPADAGASITGALETAIRAPLQSQITALQSDLTAANAKYDAAEAARQALADRPLTLTLSGRRTPAISMVTGAAGTAVRVRLRISAAAARRLKLPRTLASKTKTLDAQGAALFSLTPSARVRKAIRSKLNVTVEAAAGGVTRTAKGTLIT